MPVSLSWLLFQPFLWPTPRRRDGQLLSTLHHTGPTCSFHFNQSLLLSSPSFWFNSFTCFPFTLLYSSSRRAVLSRNPWPPVSKGFNPSISNRCETPVSLIDFVAKAAPSFYLPPYYAVLVLASNIPRIRKYPRLRIHFYTGPRLTTPVYARLRPSRTYFRNALNSFEISFAVFFPPSNFSLA